MLLNYFKVEHYQHYLFCNTYAYADVSDADASDADPSNVDPSDADPSDADPSNADPSDADPSDAAVSDTHVSDCICVSKIQLLPSETITASQTKSIRQ